MGDLNIESRPFATALGEAVGISAVDVRGEVLSPAIGVPIFAHNVGDTYPFPSSADVLEVLSDDAADDRSSGTGARQVLVTGLDINYVPISEMVLMNGLTVVETTASFLRVNAAEVDNVGSGGINAGNITIRHKTSGDQLSYILADQGIDQQAVYTVAANKTLSVMQMHFSASSTFRTRFNFGTNGQMLNEVRIARRRISNVFHKRQYPTGFLFAKQTDLVLRAEVTGTGVRMSAAFNGFLFDN